MINQITDQDRRAAMAWAKNWQGDQDDDTSAAARVILATVDAPPRTLAEELQYRATLLDNGDPDGDTPQALRDLATRAVQMEHDLAEARAEVERLTAERDALVTEAGIAREAYDVQNEALKKAHQEHADALALARIHTAEQEVLNTISDHYDRYAVQERAESNAETLDPADVSPGEAWVVEVFRERRTAVKDRDDDEPWNTVSADGRFWPENNASVTLLHRLVPAQRVITNTEDLDTLAEGSVVQTRNDDLWKKDSDGVWAYLRPEDAITQLLAPVTVLWELEA